MIRSMTGYGKGQAASEGMALSIEIKSVNHRYCDVTVKAPRSLLFLERDIKKRVGERLKRGKIDVFINQEFSAGGAAVPSMNQPLAAAYMEIFEQMRTSFDLTGEVPLSLLAAQRDVIVLKEGETPEEEVRAFVEEALNQALDAQEAMRGVEGEATRADMESRLAESEKMLLAIEERAPQVPVEWRAKLTERLDRLGDEVSIDPQRVAQEIAIFTDRCDISEELVRFRSHLEQFRVLFASEEPVGRQMDFLVQELNREVNTMGSKSNDAELTRQVVAIKAELEKVREQVQNIE